MIIKDHWYVACPSSTLGSETPAPVQIGDDHLVVFRAADGEPRALLDRCPHRGVRLSRGRLGRGRIACGYHGWEYDESGKLVHVPSLGEGGSLPACEVPSYPALERDHYVWIWIAGENPVPTYTPGLQGLVDGLWIQQTGIWQTNVMPAVENQLDVSHTAFAHPGVYPGHKSGAGQVPPLRDLEFECRTEGNRVSVFSPPREPSLPVPSLDEEGGIGLFELPYRNYVFLNNEGVRAIYNWTPLSEGSCRLEFMGATQPADSTETGTVGRVVVYVEDELEILSQDRLLLESAQHWRDCGRAANERSVAPDAAPLMARRLVERALRGDLHAGAEAPKERRVFDCRA